MKNLTFPKVAGFVFACFVLATIVCMLAVVALYIMFYHPDNLSFLNTIKQTAPIALLAVFMGTVLLVWQIFPLMRRLLQSEKKLIEANERLRDSEIRLREMAYQDPLTGLANRNRLEQFGEQTLSIARRHHTQFSVFLIDVDHLKNVNDTSGHDAGDDLLQIISKRIAGLVRDTDIVARFGGDEFVLIVTGIKRLDDIVAVAEKVMLCLREPVMIQGKEIYGTVSVGISVYPYDGTSMPVLLKNADLALYRAKDFGRNNYQFFTPEMTSHAQEKMVKQNALANALAKNEFTLHYQPIMDIRTKKLTGVEALLRWNSNQFRDITPGEIIALAEETGFIVPLSQWIFKTACQQLKQWQRTLVDEHFTMAINLSQRLIKQQNFVDNFHNIVRELALSPSSIEFEIKESILMQDSEATFNLLTTIKNLGIKIAIDDFGTGFSSLNYLRRFTVDHIKIDRIFIHQSQSDTTAVEIITAIVAMANKLGVNTIAEGVETKEQLEFLVKEGCSELQGYYLSKPLSGDEMTDFLRDPAARSSLLSGYSASSSVHK